MKSRALEWIIWLLVFSIMALWSIEKYFNGQPVKLFMGILTIAVLIGFALWQYYSNKKLPSLFAMIVYLFIFIAMGLGTFGGFYRLKHFDDFLHLTSGILLGYVGWIIINHYVQKKVVLQMSPAFIALYIISFALAAAGFWELLEFSGDKLFHFTAQGRNPDDTMFDMIDGLIGGCVSCFYILKKSFK